MAYQLRIDEIRVNPGSIDVFITHGVTPLPVEPSGKAVTFASRQDAVAYKNAAMERAAGVMLALMMVTYSRASGDAGLVNAQTAMTGRTLTYNEDLPLSLMVYS